MSDLIPYVISFENGCSLHINAKSMDDAAGEGVDSLLRCFPKDCDGMRMVRPTIIRMGGNFCALCGKAIAQTAFPGLCLTVDIGYKKKICLDCSSEVSQVYLGTSSEEK
jgi:hypothetical protein